MHADTRALIPHSTFMKLSVVAFPVLLLLTGLALLVGPVLQFLPSLTWNEGPVANAMVWHDRQRIGQILLLLAVGAGAATLWRGRILEILNTWPRLMVALLILAFVLGGVSAGVSDYARFAWLEWSTFLLLLGLVLLLADEARRNAVGFDNWASAVVLLVAAAIALRIMMGYAAAILGGAPLDSVKLFTAVVSNRRVFGQVASMVIPLLAFPLLVSPTFRVPRKALYLLLAVWWMLAIASGTRGTWLALALSTFILAVFAWRNVVPWLRVQARGLLVGLVLYGLLFVWLPAWMLPDALVENRLAGLTDLTGRAELWAVAMSRIIEHPWLGVGPMHLAAIPGLFGAHPHNVVLQLAAEWGIPAALALLLAAGYAMVRLLMTLRGLADTPLLACLAAGLLAAGAQAMVDGVVVMPYTQLWLALVAGWAMGVCLRGRTMRSPRAEFTHENLRMSRVLVSLAMLFALALLIRGVFPEMLYRVEATKAYLDAGHNGIPPRYWQVGPIP